MSELDKTIPLATYDSSTSDSKSVKFTFSGYEDHYLYSVLLYDAAQDALATITSDQIISGLDYENQPALQNQALTWPKGPSSSTYNELTEMDLTFDSLMMMKIRFQNLLSKKQRKCHKLSQKSMRRKVFNRDKLQGKRKTYFEKRYQLLHKAINQKLLYQKWKIQQKIQEERYIIFNEYKYKKFSWLLPQFLLKKSLNKRSVNVGIFLKAKLKVSFGQKFELIENFAIINKPFEAINL